MVDKKIQDFENRDKKRIKLVTDGKGLVNCYFLDSDGKTCFIGETLKIKPLIYLGKQLRYIAIDQDLAEELIPHLQRFVEIGRLMGLSSREQKTEQDTEMSGE